MFDQIVSTFGIYYLKKLQTQFCPQNPAFLETPSLKRLSTKTTHVCSAWQSTRLLCQVGKWRPPEGYGLLSFPCIVFGTQEMKKKKKTLRSQAKKKIISVPKSSVLFHKRLFNGGSRVEMWRCGNEKPDENTSGWLKMMKMKSGITTMKPKKKLTYIYKSLYSLQTK